MPKARKQQISLSDTPYYHCISRCVRRAFLCGHDSLTGKNYEHRKQWVIDRLAELAEVFAIDVCAYAIMDNHVHTVLKINADKARHWSEQEITDRWQRLFSLPVLVQQYLSGQCVTQAQQDIARKVLETWRERLMDISWMMRCLNEYIARKANAEDKCTGRFWEGRFKSQALLNEQALLACMAYVDLNPIRARLSETLEDSEFTSVKQRIEQLSGKETKTTLPLAKFIASSQTDDGIPYALKDYLELVDWTGRIVRPDKRGFIPSDTPKILHKLGLDPHSWVETVQGFSSRFHTFIGPEEQLKAVCQKQAKKWLRGVRLCRRLFNSPTSCSA